MKLSTLLGMSVSFLGFPALAQFQVFINEPITTEAPMITPTFLTDGGMITHHWRTGQIILRRYDSLGQLLWTRTKSSPSQIWLSNGSHPAKVVSDLASGSWLVHLAQIDQIPIGDPWNSEDSVLITYQVTHLNGDGSIQNASSITRKTTSSIWDFSAPDGFEITPTSDNGLLISTELYLSTCLMKVNASGTFEWGKSIPSGGHTTTEVISASPNGRIYTFERGYGGSSLSLTEMDGNGSFLGAWRYSYGNSVAILDNHDLVVDGNGMVHTASTLGNGVGQFHMLLKIAPGGTLLRGDLYRTTHALGSGQLEIDGNGRRYHRVSAYAQFPSIERRDGVLLADTIGSPGRFIQRADLLIAPNNVQFVPSSMAIRGDQMLLSGLVNHQHMDLGYTSRYETLISRQVDGSTPCMMEDTSLTHIPIPLDLIFTTTPITNITTIDISQEFETSPLTHDWATSDVEAETMCEFVSDLLGLSTSVGSETLVRGVPLIRNTLVLAGQTIQLNASDSDLIEIYDLRGSIVHREQLNTSFEIPTTGLQTGIYMIRATKMNGEFVRTGRLVIE